MCSAVVATASISAVEITKLIVEGTAALGTIAVAVLAVWGEKWRSILAPPKLVLSLRSPRGTPVPVSTNPPRRAMYYHLKITNQKRWLAVRDCRVLLTGYSKRGPDGKFHIFDLPVPLQYAWAPNNNPEKREFRTIVKDYVTDFIIAEETNPKIRPLLYEYVNSFDGDVGKDEAIRYQIEIEALSFVSTRPQVFEVAWTGGWSYEPEKMEKLLRVREITGDDALIRRID